MKRKLEKIAKVKYCKDLINQGYLKRDALKEAHTHSHTFDKYIENANGLTGIELIEVNKIIEDIKTQKPVNRVALPKNVEKFHVTTYICEPFYSAIEQEAKERNFAPSVILREHAYKNMIAEGKVKLTDII